MKARGKFLIGSGIIVVTLLALAYVGIHAEQDLLPHYYGADDAARLGAA